MKLFWYCLFHLTLTGLMSIVISVFQDKLFIDAIMILLIALFLRTIIFIISGVCGYVI